MGTPRKRYRLVTQANLDGLACAALLRERDLIEKVDFTHPRDLHVKGQLSFTDDIVTGLPFVRGGHTMAEGGVPLNLRLMKLPNNFVVDTEAPSAARVLFRYLGERKAFGERFDAMLAEVDRSGVADYGPEDVEAPEGWTLLGFVLDPRTGLGRFKEFRIGHEQTLIELIDSCRTKGIDEILALPDVAERIEAYRECDAKFTEQLKARTKIANHIGVVDLWSVDTVYPGNRYKVYALFPDIKVSIQVLHGSSPDRVQFAVGKSIFDRSFEAHIGNLMARFGGGGHANAGGCVVGRDDGEKVLKALLRALSEEGL